MGYSIPITSEIIALTVPMPVATSGTGRVVIRYSGTEALARVMIEAEDEGRMRFHAEAIAGAIREEIGV